jgi:RNA polymerase sigma factor (sigma-70 family)
MADARLAPVLRHLRRLAQPEEPSDARLLEQFVARRDADAFEALARRHGPLVWRVCRRMLPQAHDAEDAFQATFLALARRAGSVRKPESLSAWLHAAAFRIARRIRQDAGRAETAQREAAAPAADPAHQATWRELGRLVDEEVAALPEKYRLPLLLCYWEGHANDEAARRLGWPAGTVKTRLAKARQILHDRLTRRGVALPTGVVTLLLAPGPGDTAAPAVAAGASARVAALADVAVRTMTAARRPFAVTLVLAAGLAVAGVFAFEMPAPQQQPDSRPAPQAEKPPTRVDRFGDLLPEGVRARLGTSRLRHGNGTSLAFAPDGKSILTFGGDRTFRTWDLTSGRLVKEQRLPGQWWITPEAVLSPDGRLLAFQDDSEWGRHFFLWDVAGHRLLRKFELRGGGWQRMAFSPDGKTLLTGEVHGAGAVRAWDVNTGQARLLGPLTEGPPQLSLGDLFFAGNGTVAVSTERRSKALQVWDVKAGRELSRLAVPEDTLGAALSPDGRVVVSWRYSDKGGEAIQLWDAATGKPPKGLTVPRLTLVPTARFAPDGKTLWIGTRDGILLWDPAAGKAIRTLPGGAGFNLTFSPDGKTAAALGRWGGRDPYSPVARIWDVATGAPHPATRPEMATWRRWTVLPSRRTAGPSLPRAAGRGASGCGTPPPGNYCAPCP